MLGKKSKKSNLQRFPQDPHHNFIAMETRTSNNTISSNNDEDDDIIEKKTQSNVMSEDFVTQESDALSSTKTHDDTQRDMWDRELKDLLVSVSPDLRNKILDRVTSKTEKLCSVVKPVSNNRIDVDELADEASRVLRSSNSSSSSSRSKEDMKEFDEQINAEDDLSINLQRKLFVTQMQAQQKALAFLLQRREYIERQRKFLPKLIRRTERTGVSLFGSAGLWLEMWDREKLKPLRDHEQKLRQQLADIESQLATVREELDRVKQKVHAVVAPELISGLTNYERVYEVLKIQESGELRRLQAIANAASKNSCPRQPIVFMDRMKRFQSESSATSMKEVENGSDDDVIDNIAYRQSMHCFLSQYSRASSIGRPNGPLEKNINLWAKSFHGVATLGPLKRPERVFAKAYVGEMLEREREIESLCRNS